MMTDTRSIIASYEKQFNYYRSLGEKAIAQVSDEQLISHKSVEDNSIAVIVKHLWGNMRSRWTDFLNSDGEKEWRQRDDEFLLEDYSRKMMIERWDEGWDCLFSALSELDDSQLTQTIYIRNQGHSVQEAINRQLAHYSYHVGQIVVLAKQCAGENWKSLSIPRNQSAEFNKQKFEQDKHAEHYTDEWTKDDKS